MGPSTFTMWVRTCTCLMHIDVVKKGYEIVIRTAISITQLAIIYIVRTPAASSVSFEVNL